MTSTGRLTNELLIEIPKRYPHCRIGRSNTGNGPTPAAAKQAIAAAKRGDFNGVIEALQHRMSFGFVGGADISGWFPLAICDQCGSVSLPRELRCETCAIGIHRRFGIRMEVEVKNAETGDRISDSQRNFQSACEAAGVPYFIATSTEDGLAKIAAWVAAITSR